MGKRTFSREFKLEAVRLVRDRGVAKSQAARELGIHLNVLRKWIKDYEADPTNAFPGQGQMKPEAAEIERLKREIVKLKAERDILKKAAASSRKTRPEICLHREASRNLADAVDMRGARCLARRVV
jgi:transposase